MNYSAAADAKDRAKFHGLPTDFAMRSPAAKGAGKAPYFTPAAMVGWMSVARLKYPKAYA